MPRSIPSSARAHAVAVDEPALRMSHALLVLLASAGQARAELPRYLMICSWPADGRQAALQAQGG